MKRLFLLFIASALVAVACSPGGSGTSTIAPATFIPKALISFEACDDFLDYVQSNALEQVGPYGLNGYGYGYPVPFLEDAVAGFATDDAIEAPQSAPSANRDAGEGDAFSTTNVQEAGVDEPDLVKTDGDKIIAIANNRIHYVEVTEDGPRLAGTLQLDNGWASELFLSGDRAIVMTNGAWVENDFARSDAQFGPVYSELSQLLEIDLSNPNELKIAKRLTLDGRYISARMVGETIRIVVVSGPTGLVFSFPEGGGLRSEREATRENRQVILDSTEDNWIPYFVLEDRTGTVPVTTEGPLFGCADASHPDEFSGINMMTVLSIDMGEGLNGGNSIGLLADADTVYASTDNLYVATQRWQDWETFDTTRLRSVADGVSTQIHKFDITGKKADYRASGVVPGFMLSEWSLSEHNGDLRVATTTDGWWDENGGGESYVTVLRENDGELRQIGQVDGLGKGERIYAVRYMGDVAYVVTFRQTDPLYTIDLADPTKPVVMGELKIMGYSAYLHPLGDGLLLGIGQDATEQGQTLGTQVSVFDVSDLANPTRLHQWTLKQGYSEVEYDHRAFLYWAQTGLAMLPVQTWDWDDETGKESYFAGVQGLTIDREKGITEVGTVSHQPDSPDGAEDWYWMASIRRALVIGDTVYTVSEAGIEASDIETLEEIAFIKF